MNRRGALLVAGMAIIGLSTMAVPAASAATGDPLPPVVSLISPQPGADISQSSEILLYATATDPDGTITKVEFYDGSTLLATKTQELYFSSIRPGAASLGTHTLTARAYDDQGLSTTSAAVTVRVVPPVIVQIPGRVRAGVEAGCLLLTPDAGSAGSRPYLLLGGDRGVIVPGAHLLVSGEVMTNVATTCMQGVPLRVRSAEPL